VILFYGCSEYAIFSCFNNVVQVHLCPFKHHLLKHRFLRLCRHYLESNNAAAASLRWTGTMSCTFLLQEIIPQNSRASFATCPFYVSGKSVSISWSNGR
jgi:hypothetical protein